MRYFLSNLLPHSECYLEHFASLVSLTLTKVLQRNKEIINLATSHKLKKKV